MRLHRRDAMVRLGQIGLGALTLPDLLGRERTAAPAPAGGGGKARSCIFLFLWGGPPGQDLWDLKPDAPEGIREPVPPDRHDVPGGPASATSSPGWPATPTSSRSSGR